MVKNNKSYLPRKKRSNSSRSRWYSSAATEDDVYEAAKEGSIETVLRRQTSDVRVREGLRDDGETDCHASYEITYRFFRVVSVMQKSLLYSRVMQMVVRW